MAFLLQFRPVYALRSVPLRRLAEILPHENQLFARMDHQVSESHPQICKFLFLISREFGYQRSLAMVNGTMRERKYKILAVIVDHTENQITVMISAEDRIQLHIAEEITLPAIVPLIIKTESVLRNRSRYLRVSRMFLCDQHRVAALFLKYGIQLFQEVNRIQIFISAVDIGYPLTFIFAVIQIQHRFNGVHADSVGMIFLHPE